VGSKIAPLARGREKMSLSARTGIAIAHITSFMSKISMSTVVVDVHLFRIALGAEPDHHRILRLAVGSIFHRVEGHERAARGVRKVHRPHVGRLSRAIL
jgi:hypothetical protein